MRAAPGAGYSVAQVRARMDALVIQARPGSSWVAATVLVPYLRGTGLC